MLSVKYKWLSFIFTTLTSKMEVTLQTQEVVSVAEEANQTIM